MTQDLINNLFIFVLAMFAGFEVIRKVPPTLHTPLMSGANAISGVIIVGALIVAGEEWGPAKVMGFLAVVLASINVVGGFLVTDRMLKMFKHRDGRHGGPVNRPARS
jgi:NAD(P) transhydrogenase subunit alpha